MLFLIRRLTANWRAGTRMRALYLAMAAAFGGLAVVGIVAANVVVALTAAVVAVVVLGVAVLAPRLSASTRGDTTPR